MILQFMSALDPHALASPLYEPLRPWLNRLSLAAIPDARVLCALAPPGTRFVLPDSDPRYYEARIAETGEVPTRADNVHDFFNALVWCAFPATKKALNLRHIAAMPDAPPKRRGPERDFLTQLDESGAIAVCRDPGLLALWRAHHWQALFWQRRADVQADCRFLLTGHAIYEQALAPFSGMTAKAVIFGPEFFQATEAELDAELAQQIMRGDWASLKATSLPLPVLGIPGWYAANEHSDYYRDEAYFRPKR